MEHNSKIKRHEIIRILSTISITIVSIFLHIEISNITLFPYEWEGKYRYDVIMDHDDDKYELKKRIDISLDEQNMYITLYEAEFRGAYLYNEIGDVTVLVSLDRMITIPSEKSRHKTIYLNCDTLYMEMELHDDFILWRHCDVNKPEEIKSVDFYLMKKL